MCTSFPPSQACLCVRQPCSECTLPGAVVAEAGRVDEFDTKPLARRHQTSAETSQGSWTSPSPSFCNLAGKRLQVGSIASCQSLAVPGCGDQRADTETRVSARKTVLIARWRDGTTLVFSLTLLSTQKPLYGVLLDGRVYGSDAQGLIVSV